MINGIVRSFQNVLNQDSGGQVRCILLYFEEKQNTNYFDQSEAVKSPINLLMYRSFRNYSATTTSVCEEIVSEIKTILTMTPTMSGSTEY